MLINIGDMVDITPLSKDSVGIFSYAFSALFYFALAIAVRLGWRNQSSKTAIWICCLTTSLWSALVIFGEIHSHLSIKYLIQFFEFLKTCGWLYILARIIGYTQPHANQDNLIEKQQQQRLMMTVVVIAILVLATTLTQPLLPEDSWLIDINQFLLPIGFMILSIFGVIFAEQIIRNTPTAERWNVKFFCLSIGIIFAYDFLMYSHAVLFSTIHPALWKARGIVYTMVIPLLIIGINRDSARPLSLSMSRRFVFRTGTLAASSIYLITISLIGFYFKQVGGSWGELFQTVFIALGLVALVLLMFSGGARAKISIWFNQNFFSYRYDYREEWIRFNQVLTDIDSGRDISQRALTAMTNIVESVGGILWYTNEHGQFEPLAHQAAEDEERLAQSLPTSLINYWNNLEWIVNIEEIQRYPGRYTDLRLSDSLLNDEHLWVLIPLFLHDKLVGAIYLFKPRASFELNWENYDLLKIAARQVCSYLAQNYATQQLAKAQQFAAVNQATAFLVHDIKTMVAQLSLLVKNAARHKTNPAFIDDMIKTIDHTSNKMNHMLTQLRDRHHESATHNSTVAASNHRTESSPVAIVTESCYLIELLDKLLKNYQNREPRPVVRCLNSSGEDLQIVVTESNTITELIEKQSGDLSLLNSLKVRIKFEALFSALNHLIQNATEATPAEGSIVLEIHPPKEGFVTLILIDSGHGMSPDFIRNKLFHPFKSTKGLTGMGIGAYQSREYIHNSGGDLTVKSDQGQGSQFIIKLKTAPNSKKERQTAQY